MADSKFVLHYGGQEFPVADSEVLDGIAGDAAVGIIQLKTDDGRSLTITTGPGIPIAIEERKVYAAWIG